MADALSTGINLPEVIGDIDALESDIKEFRGLIQQEIDEAVRQTAQEFRDAVKDEIKASDIETDTGELMNSWKVRPKGLARYEVRSTADHAVFLELGTSEHDITGNPVLIFQPEPGTLGQYPDAVRRGGGFVEMHEVEHPGNEAYGYFQDAYDKKSWKTVLNNRVRGAANRATNEAGL